MSRTAIRIVCGVALATVAMAGSITLLLSNGCASDAREIGANPAPVRVSESARAVSLGNLRTGKPPSRFEAQLASFLFGEAPEGPLTFIKPMDLAVANRSLLVCEGAFQAVYAWSADSGVLSGWPLSGPAGAPGALAVAPGGDVLIASENGDVGRYSPDGALLRSYQTPSEPDSSIRVGGVACVGNQVWVTNVFGHRIEVFDAASGRHERSIGQRGRGPGEFGLPLGMAADGDEVFVVDMLNARVQVLSAAGVWLRDIGGPGDRLGYFGRPRSVAVGPDGTVFVTDAAWQCVHAFARDGRPLTAFGGAEVGTDALALPAGIAIWRGELTADRSAPEDFRTDYCVLVSEQVVRPGVRAYAWRAAAERSETDGRDRQRARLAGGVASPHWRSDQCTACHAAEGGRMKPIAAGDVDRLCLSCHDGVKASVEAHPIGRQAVTRRTQAPEGWPLVAGRIGCLTCHDIRRHCDAPTRPATNAALVRGFDPRSPLNTCTTCHIAETWRINPHRARLPELTSPTASCGFCHVAPPRDAPDGSRAFDAALKTSPTRICLNCHTMHPDPAPGGHLNAVVTPEIRAAMVRAERQQGVVGSNPASSGDPQLLPLDDGRVSCATCHNPHAADEPVAGVFKRPRALSRSRAPADAHKALRIEHIELCRQCHPK